MTPERERVARMTHEERNEQLNEEKLRLQDALRDAQSRLKLAPEILFCAALYAKARSLGYADAVHALHIKLYDEAHQFLVEKAVAAARAEFGEQQVAAVASPAQERTEADEELIQRLMNEVHSWRAKADRRKRVLRKLRVELRIVQESLRLAVLHKAQKLVFTLTNTAARISTKGPNDSGGTV